MAMLLSSAPDWSGETSLQVSHHAMRLLWGEPDLHALAWRVLTSNAPANHAQDNWMECPSNIYSGQVTTMFSVGKAPQHWSEMEWISEVSQSVFMSGPLGVWGLNLTDQHHLSFAQFDVALPKDRYKLTVRHWWVPEEYDGVANDSAERMWFHITPVDTP